jgi:hypothetical protein
MEKEDNAKYITKKKQGCAPNINVAFPDLHKDSDVHTQCGFCGFEVLFSIFCVKGWMDQVPKM